jgi:predicted DNA-binding transcriptional regulator AlpA
MDTAAHPGATGNKAADFATELYLDQVIAGPEMAALIGVSHATLRRMVARKEFAPPINLSPRRKGWQRRTGLQFLAAREAA